MVNPGSSDPQARPHESQAGTDLSVIVVNYNTRHLLDEMMSSLRKAALGLTVQVILIDNASTDGSASYVTQSYPDIDFIENDINAGFGRANNLALPCLKGRFVLLLNTDAFVAPDSLHVTLARMEAHPRCGILGVRLVGRDGALQPSCRYFPTPWNTFLSRTGLGRLFGNVRMVDDMAWNHASVRECDWVPGCYYLMRRELVEQIGLFDPRFFMYYEEVDHCRRAKAAGWQVLFCPDTSVIHIGGESARTVSEITESGRQISSLQIESELLYFRKHYGIFGLGASLVLTALADLVLALKWALKRRPAAGLLSYWQHLTAVSGIARRTGWGLRPTR